MVSYDESTIEERVEILKEYISEELLDMVDLEYAAQHGTLNEQWEDVTFDIVVGKVILHTRDLSYKDAEPADIGVLL